MREYAACAVLGTLAVAMSPYETGATAAGMRTAEDTRSAALSPCLSSSVKVSASWRAVNKNLPGGGAAVGTVSFTLAHGASCTLTGWPTIRLKDAHGVTVRVGQQNLGNNSGFQSAVKLTPAVAGHYKYGRALVTWLNWCKGKLLLPLKLAVSLPKETVSTVVPIAPGGRVIASCVNPTASSGLQVTAVQKASK